MKADELRALAIATLVELCEDKQTGASARATAAKTLLQLGEINAFAPAQIADEPGSIDPDELEAKLKAKLEKLPGSSGRGRQWRRHAAHRMPPVKR